MNFFGSFSSLRAMIASFSGSSLISFIVSFETSILLLSCVQTESMDLATSFLASASRLIVHWTVKGFRFCPSNLCFFGASFSEDNPWVSGSTDFLLVSKVVVHLGEGEVHFEIRGVRNIF